MKYKVVCNYNNDNNIYHIVNDIWNIDNKYELTHGNDYDYLIIFNAYNGNILVPKSNVFGFIQEPSWSGFFDKNLPDKCNKVFYHKPDIFKQKNIIQSNSIMLHHLWKKPMKGEIIYEKDNTRKIIETNYTKNKLLSIIISNRPDVKQYENRQNLVKKLLESDLDFDMYGLGWDIKDSRYKGYLYNKIDGLKNYKYSICLENSNEDGYITEKLIDSILCRTVPLYNGAPDIKKYYKSVETLDFNFDVIEQIRNIITSDKKYDFEEDIYNYTENYNPINKIYGK